MTFQNDIRNIVISRLDALIQKDEEIKTLKQNENDYRISQFAALMEKAQTERSAIIKDGERAVENILTEAAAQIHERFIPNGEDLTPDAALLNSGLTLTESEVAALIEKHKDNNTMTRLICEYANKHNYVTPQVPTEETALEALEPMRYFYRNAIQRPEFSDLWRSDEYFAEITQDS